MIDKTETLQALAERIEDYGFACRAGPLRNCHEWIELRRRLKMPPTFKPKRLPKTQTAPP